MISAPWKWLTWRGLVAYYVFFFIHLESRRVCLAGSIRTRPGWSKWRATAKAGETWSAGDTRCTIGTRSSAIRFERREESSSTITPNEITKGKGNVLLFPTQRQTCSPSYRGTPRSLDNYGLVRITFFVTQRYWRGRSRVRSKQAENSDQKDDWRF
jgi:hypothetical protein